MGLWEVAGDAGATNLVAGVDAPFLGLRQEEDLLPVGQLREDLEGLRAVIAEMERRGWLM